MVRLVLVTAVRHPKATLDTYFCSYWRVNFVYNKLMGSKHFPIFLLLQSSPYVVFLKSFKLKCSYLNLFFVPNMFLQQSQTINRWKFVLAISPSTLKMFVESSISKSSIEKFDPKMHVLAIFTVTCATLTKNKKIALRFHEL